MEAGTNSDHVSSCWQCIYVYIYISVNVKWAIRSKLLPALEEVLWRHLCGLEKLIQHDRQLHCDVLQGSTVSVHTHKLKKWSKYFTKHCWRERWLWMQTPTWTGHWALVHQWSLTNIRCWGFAAPEPHLLLESLLPLHGHWAVGIMVKDPTNTLNLSSVKLATAMKSTHHYTSKHPVYIHDAQM